MPLVRIGYGMDQQHHQVGCKMFTNDIFQTVHTGKAYYNYTYSANPPVDVSWQESMNLMRAF